MNTNSPDRRSVKHDKGSSTVQILWMIVSVSSCNTRCAVFRSEDNTFLMADSCSSILWSRWNFAPHLVSQSVRRLCSGKPSSLWALLRACLCLCEWEKWVVIFLHSFMLSSIYGCLRLLLTAKWSLCPKQCILGQPTKHSIIYYLFFKHSWLLIRNNNIILQYNYYYAVPVDYYNYYKLLFQDGT